MKNIIVIAITLSFVLAAWAHVSKASEDELVYKVACPFVGYIDWPQPDRPPFVGKHQRAYVKSDGNSTQAVKNWLGMDKSVD